MSKICLVVVATLSFMHSGAQNLYDINNITVIEIEFEEDNWDAIMDTYYANDIDERLVGTCTINGAFYDSVGVKFKGNSTYNVSNDKNPLNIKLDHILDQKYQGYETLKLSNGDKDPSFIREVMGYEIGRKYMDMPLSNYARVYINGDLYGLFNNTESINGDFVERRFYSDGEGTIVKCNPVYGSSGSGPSLEYLGTDTTNYYNSYEMKTDFGWTELMTLCDRLSNNLASIENYLDVDRALWMLAYNNVVISLDTYTGPIRQNYYLVMDDNGRMCPIIWDLNGCFGAFTMLTGGPGSGAPPTLISDLTDMDPYLREGEALWPLISQLFTVPTYRKMYMAHCRTIYEENLADDSFYSRGGELQDIIGDEVLADPNAFYTYSEFITNLDSQVGSGPGVKFGVDQVLSGRTGYLSTYPDYLFTQPAISGISTSPVAVEAYDVVTITASIIDVNYAYLGWRDYKGDAFQKEEMFDDGLHGDGAAGDDVWGAYISIAASDVQYYIYAENVDAGKFSPVRAEHEFYNLILTNDVVINEFMAKNNNLILDEEGKGEDWIELYNNTAAAIDLSGYYLSDDVTNNTKWEIPPGTTIGANDYLIIWADEDIFDSGLHANFKISAAADTVIFSKPNATVINSVVQPEMEAQTTFGRYPNGTGAFQRMIPTFSSENSYTTISVEEEDEIQYKCKLYPNPVKDELFIQIDSDKNLTMKVYDLSGQLIQTETFKGNFSISVTDWKSGFYLIRFPELAITKKVIRF